ncbi:MAG: hypothetical protein ABDH31_00080 [Chlorobiota bacterium]
MPQQRLQLTHGLRQQLKLNPALIQQQALFQKLLTLPHDELEEELLSQLAENPYLELEESQKEEPQRLEVSDTPEAESEERGTEEAALESAGEQLRTPDTTGYDTLLDPFIFHSMFWQPQAPSPAEGDGEEEEEPFQPDARPSFHEELLQQIALLNLTPEERILAEEIIGNLDHNGYLRESLSDILANANARIAELNTEHLLSTRRSTSDNPAHQYALDPVAAHLVLHHELPSVMLLQPLNYEQAERLLWRLQRELDPPGLAARNLQECLVAQLEARPLQSEAERWALRILKEAFPSLTRRTWSEVIKYFGDELTPEMLRDALEILRHLNPAPGGTLSEPAQQRSPDFIVTRDPETGEPTLSFNDSSLPRVSINRLMERLKQLSRHSPLREQAKRNLSAWRQEYYTKARALLSALQQRKETLARIMTAIIKLQRDFFEHGPEHLKPMIYADVARESGLDTSTVCRAVANKSVMTDFGVFALKDLFSEALPSTEGEGGVSVEVVKQKLRELLEREDPKSPLSDNQLAEELRKMGYQISRRTVAKYREELGFPAMWKRKELA